MRLPTSRVLVLTLLLPFAACGSDRLGEEPGANNASSTQNDQRGETGAGEIGAADRVADLSDAQIRTICADVEPFEEVECGTDPETGEPYQFSSDVTAEKCEEVLREQRESEQSCQLAVAVEECWKATPCERSTSSVCQITCPEIDECFQLDLDACESSEWCAVRQGARLTEDESCYEAMPAYCAPRASNCANNITTAIDPDGRCWLMSSICELPKGWRNEDGGRTCPYLETPGCGG